MNLLKKMDIGFFLYFGTLIYAIFFATRFFETNDDLLMMLIASGISTGEPSEYIVYQNILMGLVYKQLYLLAPYINWYSVLLSSLQTFAFIALYVLMNPITGRWARVFLFVIPLLYFLTEFSIYLQFTKIAFLTATAGVVYFIKFFHDGRTRNLVISSLFLLIGFLIREDAAYATFLVAFPLVMLLYVKYRNAFSTKKLLLFGLFLTVFLAGSKIYNHQYYERTEAWKNYVTFSYTSGLIHGNKNISDSCFEKQALALGLSPNDVETFRKWTNDDKNVYTPQLLDHIYANCDKSFLEKYKKVPEAHYIGGFFKKLFSFPSAFILVFIIYLLFSFEKRYLMFFIPYFIYFLMVLLYLYTIRFDNRVVSAMMLEFYALTFLTYVLFNVKHRPATRQLLFYGALALFASATYLTIFDKVVHKKNAEPSERQLSSLQGNYVIVAKSKNFIEFLSLSTDYHKTFEDIRLYYVGWNVMNPHAAKSLDGSANFYELLLTRPNVILYTDAHRVPVIREYIREHYKKDVEFETVGTDCYKVSRNEKL